MGERPSGDDATSASARRVILLVLAALVAGLLVVALMTSARSPTADSSPSITASPVPAGGPSGR